MIDEIIILMDENSEESFIKLQNILFKKGYRRRNIWNKRKNKRKLLRYSQSTCGVAVASDGTMRGFGLPLAVKYLELKTPRETRLNEECKGGVISHINQVPKHQRELFKIGWSEFPNENSEIKNSFFEKVKLLDKTDGKTYNPNNFLGW